MSVLVNKHYIICGDEFGAEHNGKVAIITRALYGDKYAGRDYWKHMRSFMNEPLMKEPTTGNSFFYMWTIYYVCHTEGKRF